MTKTILIQILYWIVMALLGGFASYLSRKSKLIEAAKNAIDQAEKLYKDTTKAGGMKFAWCVDVLYKTVPEPLRVIFTKEMIGGIVQRTFDAMESYAKKQLDKIADKIVPDDPMIDDGK